MNIENKTVLITGANRGIGRALVNEALRRGAKRVYAGTRGALQDADKRVMPLKLDVTNISQIQRAADEVKSLDLLINNAGIAIYDDLNNLEVLQQHLAVNLLGMLKVTHAFLPLLRGSKGAIVNNLSLAGLAALPVIPSYSISKAAAFNMTQSLRALLAGANDTRLRPMERICGIPMATNSAAMTCQSEFCLESNTSCQKLRIACHERASAFAL